MATLSVIPYIYKPYKIRRKEDGAKSQLQCKEDFLPALEIQQTTPNFHNSENKNQVNGPALDVSPSLFNSAVHNCLSSNQGRYATLQSCKHLVNGMHIARPIDLENEVNNSGNFISETTHVGVAKHGIDKRSPVALESRDCNNGTD